MKFVRSSPTARALSQLTVFSGVSAVATFAFSSVCARQLNAEQFADFTTVWSVIYVVSGTLLGALEPELARLTATASSVTASRTIRFAGTLLLTVVLVGCAAHLSGYSLVTQSWISWVGLPTLVLVAMFGEVVGRGRLAGQGRTLSYGLVAPIDALLRTGGLLIVLMLGTVDLNSSLAVMAAGSLVAAGFGLRSAETATVSPYGPSSDFRPSNLLHLMTSTAGMTLIISGVPLVSRVFQNPDARTAAGIGAVVLTARIPLLLVMGFESVLVGDFNRRLVSGESVRTLVARLAAVGFLIGLTGSAAGLAFGLRVVRLVAGSSHGATRLDIAVFATGAGLCIGCLALAPLLIAIKRHSYLSAIWMLAAGVMCAVMAFGGPSIFVTGLGFMAGNGTALLAMCLVGFRRPDGREINND